MHRVIILRVLKGKSITKSGKTTTQSIPLPPVHGGSLPKSHRVKRLSALLSGAVLGFGLPLAYWRSPMPGWSRQEKEGLALDPGICNLLPYHLITGKKYNRFDVAVTSVRSEHKEDQLPCNLFVKPDICIVRD